MFEIAIAPRSRAVLASTQFDFAVGHSFDDQLQAEQFCSDLNFFCRQPRFLVVRARPREDFAAVAAAYRRKLAA